MLALGIILRRDILRVLAELGVAGEGGPFRFLDLLQRFEVDPRLMIDAAARVADGHGLRAHLIELFHGVDGHVARTGDGADLAVHVEAAGLEHVGGEIDVAVAGGFLAGQRAAPLEALAGEHALEAAGETLVLAEHVADFAAAHADVPGGHVDGVADVAGGFGHEGLAEAHDFGFRLALGIKVAAALGAADGEPGQAVLENLLEAEELENAQIDGGVEAEAALVGPESGIELDAVAAVDLHPALVIGPRDAEHDLAFRFHDALKDAVLLVFGILQKQGFQRVEDFLEGLNEFGLMRVVLFHAADDFLHVRRSHGCAPWRRPLPFSQGGTIRF